MNVFSLLALPLLGYGLRNYHKAFLLYAILKVYMSQFIPAISLAGVPTLRLETFCTTCFAYLAYYHECRKRRQILMPFRKPFVWKMPFKFYAISIIIPSLLFAPVALFQSLSAAYLEVVDVFLFVYLFSRELKTIKDLRFLVRGFYLAFIPIICYGIFERFNGFSNPLIAYEQSLNTSLVGQSGNVAWTYTATDRNGLGRVTSVFAHAIGCGGYMSIMFVFYLYVVKDHKTIWKALPVSQVLFFLGLLLVLLFANSRGPMLFFAISILPLIDRKTLIRLGVIALISSVFLSGLIGIYSNTFISIFDSKTADSMGGGSNIAMRLGQLYAAFYVWMKNPIVGSGAYGIRYWLDQEIGLLGGESVWFRLLINQGLVGCISYVYLCVSIFQTSRGPGKWVVRFLTLGWAVFETVTSTPGISISFLMVIVLIISKLDELSPATKLRGSAA